MAFWRIDAKSVKQFIHVPTEPYKHIPEEVKEKEEKPEMKEIYEEIQRVEDFSDCTKAEKNPIGYKYRIEGEAYIQYINFAAIIENYEKDGINKKISTEYLLDWHFPIAKNIADRKVKREKLPLVRELDYKKKLQVDTPYMTEIPKKLIHSLIIFIQNYILELANHKALEFYRIIEKWDGEKEYAEYWLEYCEKEKEKEEIFSLAGKQGGLKTLRCHPIWVENSTEEKEAIDEDTKPYHNNLTTADGSPLIVEYVNSFVGRPNHSIDKTTGIITLSVPIDELVKKEHEEAEKEKKKAMEEWKEKQSEKWVKMKEEQKGLPEELQEFLREYKFETAFNLIYAPSCPKDKEPGEISVSQKTFDLIDDLDSIFDNAESLSGALKNVVDNALENIGVKFTKETETDE